MPKVRWLFVMMLITACGNNRHHALSWPASLAEVSGFTGAQRQEILAAITELNGNVRRTFVAPEGVEEGSPIHIRFAESIPDRKGVIAGRATVDGEKCVILISSAAASRKDLLVPVLWHEIGHCAGLSHDSTSTGEIMSPTNVPMKEYDEGALSRFFSKILSSSGIIDGKQ